MPIFHYKAVTEPGDIVEGELDLPDQAAVIDYLRGRGLLPLQADERRRSTVSAWFNRELGGGSRLSRAEIASTLREVATLLKAGLALDQALDVVIAYADKAAVQTMMKQVLDRVRDGVSLAEAMSMHGRGFDRFSVGMVRAGEAGGTLDVALAKAAEHIEKTQESKQKLRSSLLYPVILLVSAALSVAIIVTVVIPSFKDIFDQAGIELPLVTRIVLAIGNTAQAFWWVPVLLVAVTGLTIARQRREPGGRRVWDRRTLKIPFLGALITKSEVARVSYTLGMLLSNGVPLTAALAVAKDTLGNAAMADAFEGAGKQVKEGKTVSGPLAETDLVPRHATHLIRIGEESGRLEEMLFRVAEIYEAEVQRSTQRLLTLLLPVLTFGMALLIGGIIGSILVPMLNVHQLAF
jgi:general secretion pathway protein F